MLMRLLKGVLGRSSRSDGPIVLPPRSIPSQERLSSFFFPVFWGVSEPETFTADVEKLTKSMAPGYHASDNFITWGRNNSMFEDRAFTDAWERNIESPSDRAIVWRRYVLATSAFHAVQLPGDFVECGAYTGVGVKTVVDYLGGVRFPKPFWAYDAFEHDASMANHSMPELGAGL